MKSRSELVRPLQKRRWTPMRADEWAHSRFSSDTAGRPRPVSWSQIFADIVRCEQRMLLNKLYSYLALSTTLDYVQKIIPITIVDTSKLLPPISSLSPKFQTRLAHVGIRETRRCHVTEFKIQSDAECAQRKFLKKLAQYGNFFANLIRNWRKTLLHIAISVKQ